MTSRKFTVEEANETLPLVRSIAGDVVRAYQELSQRAEAYKQLRGEKDRTHEVEEALNEMKRTMGVLGQEIDTFVTELGELGCEMKDLGSGTVDFPSDLDGRPVYLCWRPGEDRIDFWHEVTDGFAGRRPLPVTVPPED